MDQMSLHGPSVTLSPATLNRAAVCLVGLLLLLGIGAESLAILLDDDWLFGLFPIVSLQYSQNLPTWALTMLFAAAGSLAGLLYAIDRAQGRPSVRWLGLGGAMLGASLETFADMGTGMGAGMMGLLRAVLGPAALADLLLRHPFVAMFALGLAAVLGGCVLVVGYRSLKAWWSLPPASRRCLALGVAVLAAAPWIEARSLPLGALSADETLPSSLAVWIALAQSALKLLGAYLVCLALIRLLAERGRPILFAFAAAPGARVGPGLRGAQKLPAAVS